MSQKVEKVHNFLDPPGYFGLFWIWEKLEIWRPSLVPNLGKNWNWENFEFWEPPSKKTISLKHLKLPKNHFKSNLFFVQLKHLKSTFTFGGKNENSTPTPHLSKFCIVDFLIFGTDPGPQLKTLMCKPILFLDLELQLGLLAQFGAFSSPLLELTPLAPSKIFWAKFGAFSSPLFLELEMKLLAPRKKLG